MGNIPLHPLIVHFPIALAALLPVVLAGLWWAERRGRITRSVWWVGVAMAALLTISSYAALQTGRHTEERVEHVVPEAAIGTHEERAEAFLWATGGVVILAALAGLVRQRKARQTLAAVTVVSSLAVAGLAVLVGHSGGRLVYQYDAARAYATDRATMGGSIAQPERQERTSYGDRGGRKPVRSTP